MLLFQKGGRERETKEEMEGRRKEREEQIKAGSKKEGRRN